MKLPIISYIYSIPYLFVFALLVLLALLQQDIITNRYSKNNLTVVAFVIVLLFMGLRGYVYSDWIAYYEFFHEIPYPEDLFQIDDFVSYFGYEIGFLVTTSFLKSIIDDYNVYIFIWTLIDLLILTHFFKHSTKYPVWCIAVFFAINGIMMEFNLIRNIKSIVLFMFSLKYVQNGQPVKYFIVNSIGFLFHSSALLFFPLYFILRRDYGKKLILILFILSNIIYFLQIPLSRTLVLVLSSLIGGRLHGLAEFYSEMITSYGFSVAYFERIITFFIIYFNYDVLKQDNKDNIVYINLYVLYFVTFSICWDFSLIIERVAGMLIIAYWLVFPKLLEVTKKRYSMISLIFYIVMICSLKLVLNNNNIMARYDNLIFGIQSVSERESIQRTYIDYLIN